MDYFDEQFANLDSPITPLEVYRRITRTPSWLIRGLFKTRDLLVRPFGLQPIGGFDSARRTERDGVTFLDFFERLSCDAQSLKLAASDHPLDVLILIRVDGTENGGKVSLTARVQCKNWIGRLYMAPVGPIPRWLVRSTLKTLPLPA